MRYFEFYRLREKFISDQDVIISDCNEPDVEKYLKTQYPLPSEYDEKDFETAHYFRG